MAAKEVKTTSGYGNEILSDIVTSRSMLPAFNGSGCRSDDAGLFLGALTQVMADSSLPVTDNARSEKKGATILLRNAMAARFFDFSSDRYCVRWNR